MRILLLILSAFILNLAKADSTRYHIISLNIIPSIASASFAPELAWQKVNKKLFSSVELGGIIKGFNIQDKPFNNSYHGINAKVMIGRRVKRKRFEPGIGESLWEFSIGMGYSAFFEKHRESFPSSNYGSLLYTYPRQSRQVISIPLRISLHFTKWKFVEINPGIEMSLLAGSIDKDVRFPSPYIPGAGLNFDQSPAKANSIGLLTGRFLLRLGYRFY